MNTGRAITVDGVPYQYEAEATAGINLSSGEHWFGTQVKYRAGLRGHWQRLTLIDVHPFDFHAIETVVADHIAPGAGQGGA